MKARSPVLLGRAIVPFLTIWVLAETLEGTSGVHGANMTQLEQRVLQVEKEHREITRALLVIAGNLGYSDADRKTAFDLLARAPEKETREFCIEYLTLQLPSLAIRRSWEIDAKPCYKILYQEGFRNWAFGKAVLDSLDQRKTETELMYLRPIFKRSMWPIGRTVVEDELSKRPKGYRKTSLEYFHKHWDQD